MSAGVRAEAGAERRGTRPRPRFGTHMRQASRTSSSHLGLVDGGEPDVHPRGSAGPTGGHEELVRLGCHQGRALLLGEAEAHDLLVAGERQEDNAADPELHPVPDQGLISPRQLPAKARTSSIVHHDAHACADRAPDRLACRRPIATIRRTCRTQAAIVSKHEHEAAAVPARKRAVSRPGAAAAHFRGPVPAASRGSARQARSRGSSA